MDLTLFKYSHKESIVRIRVYIGHGGGKAKFQQVWKFSLIKEYYHPSGSIEFAKVLASF